MMAAYSERGVHGQIVQLLGERVLSGEIAEGRPSTWPRSAPTWA